MGQPEEAAGLAKGVVDAAAALPGGGARVGGASLGRGAAPAPDRAEHAGGRKQGVARLRIHPHVEVADRQRQALLQPPADRGLPGSVGADQRDREGGHAARRQANAAIRSSIRATLAGQVKFSSTNRRAAWSGTAWCRASASRRRRAFFMSFERPLHLSAVAIV